MSSGENILQRHRSRWARMAGRILADSAVIAASLYCAFLLRFDGVIPPRYFTMLHTLIPLTVGLKIFVFLIFRIYHFSWTYVGLEDLFNTVLAVGVGSLALTALLFVARTWPSIQGFPRSTLAIDFAFTVLGIVGVRLSKRIVKLLFHRKSTENAGPRALIIGAGDAGEQLVRSLKLEKRPSYQPIGFLDDDPRKHGLHIHGVPVLGARSSLSRIVRSKHVDAVLIAMPSAHPRVIRETVELARKAGIRDIKIIPYLSELYAGEITAADLRDVQPEELLRREPVQIDAKEIEGYLRGRKVLVTGAAGSIGSELCRQIARFGAKQLIMLDQEETGLFNIDKEIEEKFPRIQRLAILADITEKDKMERVFLHTRPDIIFHAAAYKHVSMARKNPDETVKVNVFGTLYVGEAAILAGTDRFVLISTDKAVNPVGIMGMTKRIAEMIILALNEKGVTKFSAVRFGNVLGSRGSVIQIFKEQIRRRGPVTITHPEMRRYFMLPSEAVLLVLQAGALGNGGEVFVLDMGDPVKILDLAREMIQLSGYEPDTEIPIIFTAPDEDEKIFEDILTAEEGTDATKHKQIYIAKMSKKLSSEKLYEKLRVLEELVRCGADEKEIREKLQEIIYGQGTDRASHALTE